MIKCELCNKLFKSVNWLHLRNHNISFAEYFMLYLDATCHSEDTRNNISKGSLGNKHIITKPNYRKGLTLEQIYGVEKSTEVRNKQHLAKLGKVSQHKGLSLEQEYGVEKANKIKEAMRRSRIGKTYEEIYGEKGAMIKKEELREYWGKYNPMFDAKIANQISKAGVLARLGKEVTNETRIKISKASKLNWLNPDFGCNKPEYWVKLRKSKCMKPNGLERYTIEVLDNAFGIGVWEFVGDYKLIIKHPKLIKRRCPDFKHGKQNKLIEVFNEYDKNRKYGSISNYKTITTRFYEQCGYEVIYFNQDEIKKDTNQTIEKIDAFMEKAVAP